MTVIRRLAIYMALPLTLIAIAGYCWYQFSDTGKRLRYEDKLASYCQGLIPSKESAVLTDYDTKEGLQHDEHHGGSDGYEFCWVGKTMLTIARIPESARDDDGTRGVFDELRPAQTGTLPMSLGGGWHGYTNLKSAAAVLECQNEDASIVVSASGIGDVTVGRSIVQLTTATAVKAAEHWNCKTEAGGPIPDVAAEPEEKSRLEADGTCAGIPMRDLNSIHWIKETQATASYLEDCVLGETKASAAKLFHIQAFFGPFAQAQYPNYETTDSAGRHGTDFFWATAQCPSTSARALFTISATEYAPDGMAEFKRKALAAFAERSAAQHKCTDLKLPS